MATRTDIRNRIAKELRIVAGGETLSAEDASDIEETITDTQSQLEDKEDAYWVDGDYPDELVAALVKIMSFEAAQKYGISQDKMTAYAAKQIEGYRDLRAHLSVRVDDRPIAADYF